MTTPDPNTCRRALREIGEIAAVSVLEDSQMTAPEALQTIAAIAQWVSEELPAGSADCGEIIRQLNALTAANDFEAISDQEAVALFGEVCRRLESDRAGWQPAPS